MKRTRFRAVELASGWLLERTGNIWWHRGLRFHVPPETSHRVFRGRFLLGLYERPERRLLRHLPRDATLLELGGCLGVVACLANRRLDDPSRHLVVEADPATLPALLANRDANGASFAILHAAAGGDGRFWPGTNPVAGSAHRPRGEPIRVPLLDLAAEEEARGLRFDAYLLDIEGGEVEFIAREGARMGRARFAMIEFHPQFVGEAACREARERLRDAGLVLRASDDDVEVWARP